ncbi:GtrA family protein [Paenibacillus sedimenti]|uniref:GtrA family protein n=1 Tax=Paenibacillus sedimenti TaxID=2770274 RepID=A0A926QHT1_9BACL|nr:GtrA family protein [Paenibacillus sedimenti]MBD0379825.1 GtrA family protein [Paenibacillus sedimenti]
MGQLKVWATGSFARFLLVGLFNTLVGLTTSFALFNLLYLNYWMSTFLGNTVGAIVSFMLNRTFTFRSQASIRSSWWKFALVILSCYGISYGVSWQLADIISSLIPSLHTYWLHNAAILAGNGIYMIGNYLGHKYFTFRR